MHDLRTSVAGIAVQSYLRISFLYLERLQFLQFWPVANTIWPRLGLQQPPSVMGWHDMGQRQMGQPRIGQGNEQGAGASLRTDPLSACSDYRTYGRTVSRRNTVVGVSRLRLSLQRRMGVEGGRAGGREGKGTKLARGRSDGSGGGTSPAHWERRWPLRPSLRSWQL